MGNSIETARFSSLYESGEVLGRGTFAVVKKCSRKSDNKEFAVKIVDKRQLTAKELVLLKDEIKMLGHIECVYAIKMFNVFDNGVQVKIVLELCTGGNLFDLISKQENHHLDEPSAAKIASLIARGLKYLHSHYIVHRDLKPENILFTDNGTLKITDFGLGHYMKVPQDLHYMHTCCGTPHYVAPEVLTANGVGSGQYDHYGCEIDYWSLGVIVFIMLSGKQPFVSRSINAMYQLIIRGTYQFDSPTWDNVSSEATDLIKSLLCVDFHKRMSYDTLIKHAWIKKYVDEDEFAKEEENYLQDLQKLKSHHADNDVNKNDHDNVSLTNNKLGNFTNDSHTEQNINKNDKIKKDTITENKNTNDHSSHDETHSENPKKNNDDYYYKPIDVNDNTAYHQTIKT